MDFQKIEVLVITKNFKSLKFCFPILCNEFCKKENRVTRGVAVYYSICSIPKCIDHNNNAILTNTKNYNSIKGPS